MWIKGISTKPSERHFYYTYPIYKNDSSVESLNKEIRKLKKIIKNNSLNFLVVILPYEFQTRKENCNDQFLLPQKKINEILLNENIKYILNGHSFRTEGTSPISWTYMDGRYVKNVLNNTSENNKTKTANKNPL